MDGVLGTLLELQKAREFLDANIGVSENAFENFGVKDFRGMKRNGDSLASGILVNHVASALSCERKSCLFEHSSDLAGGKARKLRH
jgi:hypothetical protein